MFLNKCVKVSNGGVKDKTVVDDLLVVTGAIKHPEYRNKEF